MRKDDTFQLPEYAHFRLRHNPAHDFVLFSRMLAKAPAKKFNQVFSAEARNPLGVIIAACAVEGYINFVGNQVDPNWEKFIKGKNTVNQRIARIYSVVKKQVDLRSDLMQSVAWLFQMRNALVHPQIQDMEKHGSAPPLSLLERVDAEFPAAKSCEIALTFRETILRDSEVNDFWSTTSFVEKPNPRAAQARAVKGSDHTGGCKQSRLARSSRAFLP